MFCSNSIELVFNANHMRFHTINDVTKLAESLGAKYPQLVAAQWALESNYGKHTSGKNNYFGLKGEGTMAPTWEDYGQGSVTIVDSFKNFPTPHDCVKYLIDLWYKDYKGYKGVNRANSATEAARLLQQEGYATDPQYASKLIELMETNV